MLMNQSVCALCAEINHTEKQLQEITLAIKRLQKQAAPLFKEYMANRSAHPRCASCTILTGPNHLENSLVPEPMVPRAKGQRRYLVCDTCYIDLHKAKMSVPQRKKYNLDAEQMLEQETAEEEDTESVGIAEDEE
jgi:hypothetical protein